MLPEQLPDSPLKIFADWLQEERTAGLKPNPDSMALATCGESGQPTVRIVLCKEIVIDPGYLVFYTNYQSPKATDIEIDDRVAAAFHWDQSGRQVRIEGVAVKSPATECDEYFSSRDINSQIGAWASQQSEVIESRQQLLQQFQSTVAQYQSDTSSTATVPRPPHWGGYRIWIAAVELWVSAEARLHDRARWSRNLPISATGYNPGPWTSSRIQP